MLILTTHTPSKYSRTYYKYHSTLAMCLRLHIHCLCTHSRMSSGWFDCTEPSIMLALVLVCVSKVTFALSYPNNPNGVKRNPLVKNPDHVIRDMVYYWPMYTDTSLTISEPIMIFSRYIYMYNTGSQAGVKIFCMDIGHNIRLMFSF